MAGRIDLEDGFRVFWGGLDLGRPPNGRVGALLAGMVLEGGRWFSRRELGELLHGDSVESRRAGALRQSLARLRRWLPAGVLEEVRGQVRLSGEWVLSAGSARGVRIGAGVEHPWMGEVRRRLTEGGGGNGSIEAAGEAGGVLDFAPGKLPRTVMAAVGGLAEVDRTLARQLLHNVPGIQNLLSVSDVTWLHSRTAPSTREEPFAVEHEEMRAALHYRVGDLAGAVKASLRAYRWSLRARDAAAQARTAALTMFYLIERGEMGAAESWLGTLLASDASQRFHLLVRNAQACLFWNGNRLAEALPMMRSGEVFARSSDRVVWLHYLVNLAKLEAEVGDLAAAEGTAGEAESVLLRELDANPQITLALTRAEIFGRRGLYREALGELELARSVSLAQEMVVGEWYVGEAEAMVLRWSGEVARAREVWLRAEACRLERCVGLTPRVAAWRRVVMGG